MLPEVCEMFQFSLLQVSDDSFNVCHKLSLIILQPALSVGLFCRRIFTIYAFLILIACGHGLLLLLMVHSSLDVIGRHFYDVCVILLGCFIVD